MESLVKNCVDNKKNPKLEIGDLTPLNQALDNLLWSETYLYLPHYNFSAGL